MESNYWNRTLGGRISRRSLFRGTAIAAAGLAGAALIGCGGDEDDDGPPAAGGGGGGTGGGGTGVQDVPRGGKLIVGVTDEPPNLDPHFGASGGERQYLHLFYDRLFNSGPDGLLDPSRSLALSWEQVDATTVNVKLRSGITMYNSDEPVDAELVKWNIDRARAEGATSRSELLAIESVDVVSTDELVIKQNAVSAPLLSNFTDRAGTIISRRKVEELGKDEFGRNPLGSGPFQLKEWLSDASLKTVRNPNHWMKDEQGRPKPYLDEIEFKIIPETTVLTAALENGEVDVIATPSTEFTRLQENTELHTATFVGSHTYQWYINHEFPPYDNINFRRAFSRATDRNNFIKNFLKGIEPLGKGLLTPASWAWDESIVGHEFDLAEARKYLEASGLPEDKWVAQIQPNGATSLNQRDEFWQASLAKAGIKVNYAEPERGGYATRLFKGLGADGTSAAFNSTWSMRIDPDANIAQFYVEKGGYNSGQVPTPETEPLVKKARETLDINERRELYVEIQRIALDKVYSTITIGYAVAVSHAHRKVGNLDLYYGAEGKERWYEIWVDA